MTAASESWLGIGLYTPPEAARLLCLPARKLSNWAYGYTFQYRDQKRRADPVILRQIKDAGDMRVLSFLDLVDLLFVRIFRECGVSMPVIRAAAVEARRRFGHDHPFAVKQFSTDGKAIFATLDLAPEPGMTEEELVEQLDRSQMVFGTMVEPFFVRYLDVGSVEVDRHWPLGKEEHVVLDPERSFGKPIDVQSGVQTYILYEAHRAGEAIEAIADWYDISQEGVSYAIKYEEALANKALYGGQLVG